MNLIIRNTSGQPIYDQITAQIKALILSGELQAGDTLPSMRALAKDLRISVITTKRAYEELEREGFIISQTGRGSFVASVGVELLREEQLRRVEAHLEEAAKAAHLGNLERDEFLEIAAAVFEEGI